MTCEEQDQTYLQYLLDTQRPRRRRRHQEQCEIIQQLTEQLQLQNEQQQLHSDLELRLDRMWDDKERFMTAYHHLSSKMACTECRLKLDTTPDGGCLEVMCDCLRL